MRNVLAGPRAFLAPKFVPRTELQAIADRIGDLLQEEIESAGLQEKVFIKSCEDAGEYSVCVAPVSNLQGSVRIRLRPFRELPVQVEMGVGSDPQIGFSSMGEETQQSLVGFVRNHFKS